jgi:hypothetical protein
VPNEKSLKKMKKKHHFFIRESFLIILIFFLASNNYKIALISLSFVPLFCGGRKAIIRFESEVNSAERKLIATEQFNSLSRARLKKGRY